LPCILILLNDIHVDDDEQSVTIGALTTHRDVETSQITARYFPVISQAYKFLGSPQVRNLGTLGGNLCHNAPGSDPPPILLALGASVTVQKKDGTRKESVETFGTDYYETTLAEDEILTQIEIPLMKENEGTAYQKYAVRKTDMAIVGAAAWVRLAMDKETCEDIRIGLSGVHAAAVRAASVENALRGVVLDLERIKTASHEAQQDIDPISDVHATEEYRREVLPIAIQRVVTQAWDQALMR